MDALVQFIKKTKELVSLLEEDFPVNQRDEQIQKMNQLLEDRQVILKEVPDLSSLPEHTKLELRNLEHKLQLLMKKQKEKIKQDLKTLQLKKQKGNQYSNPYENLAADGMFLDKKK